MATDLLLIQAALFLRRRTHSSLTHRAPATRTKSSTLASRAAQPKQ
jgi:hypothetical protein